MKKLILTSFVSLLFSLILISNLYSAEFYISPTGNDSTGDGSIGLPWLTLEKGVEILIAGDTLYCRGGTYTSLTDAFDASVVATSGSPITVTNYSSEVPIFRTAGSTNNGSGIDLVGYITGDYYTFENLEFRSLDAVEGCVHAFYLNGAHHNIFRNITFVSTLKSDNIYTAASSIFHVRSSTYNDWDSCTLYGAGDYSSTQGSSGNIIILWGYGDSNNHNRIFDNTLSQGCHDNIKIGTNTGDGWNEVYDNTIVNARGYGVAGLGSRNIVERNVISDCDIYTKGPIFHKGDYNIARYNSGYDSIRGFSIYSGVIYNKIYNNVFYSNDEEGVWAQASSPSQHNRFINNVIAHNMEVASWTAYYGEIAHPYTDGFFDDTEDNQFKYNWIVSYVSGAWQDDYAGVQKGKSNNKFTVSYMETNYTSWANNVYNYVDPKFNDAAGGDFTLQVGSSLIDAGAALTQSNGSGSASTSLIVDDAGYFWYSTISSVGDQIAIGNPNTIRTITAINYGTNTITLNSAATWGDGTDIFLYKSFSDSSTVLLSGTAPDIGAYEYDGGPAAIWLRIVP